MGDGGSALTVAAVFNQVDAAKVLIRYGADPNAREKDVSTALSIAIDSNKHNTKKELIRLLMQSGGKR
jgi:ankyrin repeat protein